jgi:GT2 family glycosyltransferase
MTSENRHNDYPLVLVVVVTYNSLKYIDRCIQSIEMQQYENKRILIIDNNSTDNTVNVIHKHILVYKNQHNRGYASAVNQGLLHGLYIGAKYILILNPDTKMYESSLLHLVEAAESDREIGVVGPEIVDENASVTGYSNIGVVESGITWISGCGMLLRSKVITDVGLFDTRYFLYYEETDYLLRMTRKHWKIAKCNSATILHTGSVSTNTIKTRAFYIMIRNIFVYSKKNMINNGYLNCIRIICSDVSSKFYFPMHPLMFFAFVMGIICGTMIFLKPSRIEGELI